MLLFFNEAFLNDEPQILLNSVVFEDLLAFQRVSLPLVDDPVVLSRLSVRDLLLLLLLYLADSFLPLLKFDSLLLKALLDVFQSLLFLLLLLFFVEEHPFLHQFHTGRDVLRVVDRL